MEGIWSAILSILVSEAFSVSGFGDAVKNVFRRTIEIYKADSTYVEILKLISAKDLADVEISAFCQAYKEAGDQYLLQSKDSTLPSIAGVFESAFQYVFFWSDDIQLKNSFEKYIRQTSENITKSQIDLFFLYLLNSVKEKKELTEKIGHRKLMDSLKNIDTISQEILRLIQEMQNVKSPSSIHSLDDCTQLLSRTHASDPSDSILQRDCIIEKLKTLIFQKNEKRIALSGFSGVGKSMIARKLYHAVKDGCEHIAWIEYQGSLKESLLRSLIDLEITEEEVRWTRIQSLLGEMKEDTFLFIDGINDISQQDQKLLETIGATLILTLKTKVEKFKSVPVDFFDEDQCVEIFYHYYEDDKERNNIEIVRLLIQMVSYHTLSVELVARSANIPGMSLQAFYERLKKEGFQYSTLHISTDHTRNEMRMSEHLKKLFDISPLDESHQYVLNIFSVMPTLEIPMEIYENISQDHKIYQELTKRGFLTVTKNGYSMHSIVRIAYELQYHVTYEDCALFIQYMSGNDFIDEKNIYTKVRMRLLIAESFLKKYEKEETVDYAIFCHNIAGVYYIQGDYPKALEWFQKALTIRETVLGKEHPSTATTYNNIAGVYYIQGDYPKALEWFQKALTIMEKVLGKEHPDTATTYNNIAVVYSNQGDYSKALEWYQKALTIREKVLEKEHPYTATTCHNIARVYDSQGDYPKALEWFQKALTIQEKILGKEHPDTATTYNNIAVVYYSQGDYSKALEWYQKALTIREKVLGKEHPNTATSYNGIAVVYYSQGDYSKALEWYQKALTIQEKVLGKEHPDTATTYNNIAGVYDSQGDYPKALEWFQKALTIKETVLGKEHPSTATTYNNIAGVYDSQGNYPKALEWFQKALTIKETVLGKEHPDTRSVRKNLEICRKKTIQK